MPERGDPEAWKPTERQVERAERSKALLRGRQVPIYPGPLYLADDEEVALRDGPDVVRRMLALWAVVLRAEGMPREEALGLIDRAKLWDAVSPKETQFLQDTAPDPTSCEVLVWRLESLWVLLWALGRIRTLVWPRGMCDVPRLVELMRPYDDDTGLAAAGTLRPKSEILDAQDLIMRIHWAVRDAWLADRMIPAGLDWSADDDPVPIATCPAVGVVEQRHHTLNWLVRFLDADWDEVQTPT